MDNRVKTVFLLACLTGLIMFMGQVIGGSFGLKIAFGLAMCLNLGAYWFSADLVLVRTRARVIGQQDAPQLYELVAHLSQRAGLPMPRVAIVDDPSPNAFATGRNPKNAVVAVTSGLLDILNREELAGVLSHELAHVQHRDILIGSVAAAMAGVIMILADMVSFAALAGRGGDRKQPAIGIAVGLLAPLAACLIQAAISRSREYLADDAGANIADSSLGLASALEKLRNAQLRYSYMSRVSPETASLFIINPLRSTTLTNLFASHPPIEERIARLRGLYPN